MEAAEAEPLPVKDALDSGQTLVPRQLRELLDLQASVPEGELHAAIAALNEEGTAPRALLGAHLPSVHVKGLIAAAAANGRRSILVFLSKADQPRKRKRGRPDGLPAGPRWQGNGLGGRCVARAHPLLPLRRTCVSPPCALALADFVCSSIFLRSVDFLDMARGGAPPVIGKRSCTQRQKDATGKVTAEASDDGLKKLLCRQRR